MGVTLFCRLVGRNFRTESLDSRQNVSFFVLTRAWQAREVYRGDGRGLSLPCDVVSLACCVCGLQVFFAFTPTFFVFWVVVVWYSWCMDEIKRVLGLDVEDADWCVLVGVQTFLEWSKGVAVRREAEESCLRALREQTGELLRERMVGDGFDDEVIAEMMEKYPLKVQVVQLGSYISDDSEGARCGCKTNGGNVLVRVQINQDHEKGGVHGFHAWKPYDEAKAAKRGFSRFNVGVTENGIDIRAVMIHEWGHALHALARCSDGYGYLMTKANSADVAQDAYNWRHWRDVVFERAKKEGFVNKLSEYSKTNSREFFAECFAARELGEKLPDYVEESLDKIIKRATRKL